MNHSFMKVFLATVQFPKKIRSTGKSLFFTPATWLNVLPRPNHKPKLPNCVQVK